ncbi:MAG: hypothetical protein JWL90_669 [Chthoniobacteraceae bacterium]|nr:hypothetical protein [Chthoniobacteraceae bacterium]
MLTVAYRFIARLANTKVGSAIDVRTQSSSSMENGLIRCDFQSLPETAAEYSGRIKEIKYA